MGSVTRMGPATPTIPGISVKEDIEKVKVQEGSGVFRKFPDLLQ